MDYSKLNLKWTKFEGNKYEVGSGDFIKTADGEIYLVGDLLHGCSDGGCGCCSYSETPVEIASLESLLTTA